jgi:hypothetical protein
MTVQKPSLGTDSYQRTNPGSSRVRDFRKRLKQEAQKFHPISPSENLSFFWRVGLVLKNAVLITASILFIKIMYKGIYRAWQTSWIKTSGQLPPLEQKDKVLLKTYRERYLVNDLTEKFPSTYDRFLSEVKKTKSIPFTDLIRNPPTIGLPRQKLTITFDTPPFRCYYSAPSRNDNWEEQREQIDHIRDLENYKDYFDRSADKYQTDLQDQHLSDKDHQDIQQSYDIAKDGSSKMQGYIEDAKEELREMK